MSPNITRKQLKKFFRYNPKTGIFVSAIYRTGCRGVGLPAGGLGANGYVQICFRQKLYYAHRLAWLWVHGKWPKVTIDHFNEIRTDNRISNLRLATGSQNNSWCKMRSHNTSGFRGVCLFKRTGKWIACVAGIHLGYYSDKVEAAKAYDCAAIKHFGKFAKTNRAMGLL